MLLKIVIYNYSEVLEWFILKIYFVVKGRKFKLI